MADITGLKTAFEEAIATLKRGDLKAWTGLWDHRVVRFGPFSVSALDASAALRDEFRRLFVGRGTVNLTIVNSYYRMAGDIGIASGRYSLASPQPSNRAASTKYRSYTSVLMKSVSGWRFVGMQIEEILVAHRTGGSSQNHSHGKYTRRPALKVE